MKSNNYAVHYNWVFERKIEWTIGSVKYALTEYFGDETVFEEKMKKMERNESTDCKKKNANSKYFMST